MTIKKIGLLVFFFPFLAYVPETSHYQGRHCLGWANVGHHLHDSLVHHLSQEGIGLSTLVEQCLH